MTPPDESAALADIAYELRTANILTYLTWKPDPDSLRDLAHLNALVQRRLGLEPGMDRHE